MKKNVSKKLLLLFIILLGVFYEYLLIKFFWSRSFVQYHDIAPALSGIFGTVQY